MGKYAKIALALLYVAQLAIAFREQLVTMYKHAAEIVRREDSVEHVSHIELEPTLLKRASPQRFNPNATMVATPLFHALAMAHTATHHEEHPHPPHNDDDKHKDKAKKQRLPRIREIVYANLYPLYRTLTEAPSSVEPREAVTAMQCGNPAYCAA